MYPERARLESPAMADDEGVLGNLPHSRPGKPLIWSISSYCSEVIPLACVTSSLNRKNRRNW